jgi:dTDP-4-amino-4,6-dideoxygalactose transaminase
MDTIMSIARRHQLMVVEDAAQGVMASYKGRSLGSIGDLGAYSFHETKNVISGEGGALLVNDPELSLRAEIIREKGTDRSRFFRGEVDKYTWQEVGSSFLPGELIAAFLWAQLEEADRITQERLNSWQTYHELLEPMEAAGILRRPIIPADCEHNAHMYYVLLAPSIDRQAVLEELKRHDIWSVFHYVPLHSSPAGKRYGRASGSLEVTDRQSERLIRLPLWVGLTESQQERVVDVLKKAISC